MNGLKRFLGNKNTITIIGVLLIIVIIYFGYTTAVKRGTESVTVPYAKVAIQPRTKITEDMIGYTKVLKSTLQGNVISNDAKVINRYSNINSLIPKGSLFYSDAIVPYEELPDAVLTEIPDGLVAFNLAVDINSTYGNSVYPGNYIDIYFKGMSDNNKVMVGKLLSNVKVLAVKDGNGHAVFENSEEERHPAMVIFGVEEEIYLLLKKATFLSRSDYQVELIPVPTNESLKTKPGETALTSTELVTYINSKSVYVSQDTLNAYEENSVGE